MNQDFKLNFGQSEGSVNNATADDKYSQAGNVRNICFQWPDGRQKFLNYSYLVSVEFNPEEGIISLVFTSEMVVLTGSALQTLFDNLLDHIPRRIKCIDARYGQIEDTNSIVTKIEMLQNKS